MAFSRTERGDFRYTDFTNQTEFFALLTEETVYSVCSVYKREILSTFLEKTIAGYGIQDTRDEESGVIESRHGC